MRLTLRLKDTSGLEDMRSWAPRADRKAKNPASIRLWEVVAVACLSFACACEDVGAEQRAVYPTITGASGMSSWGEKGGPFSPSGMTCTLSNGGSGSLEWNASGSQPWLDIAPSRGTLAPGASTNVTVSIGAAAAALSEGRYQGTVTVANTTNGDETTSSVALDVTSRSAAAMTSASRTSGVAPLAVFFDAVGDASGVVQPKGTPPDYSAFHYAWMFADPTSGSWLRGESRNSAMGYVAAHVFETPGTYRVRLRVTEDDGKLRDHHQDVVVQDPEVVFAGRTFHVSAAGDDSNDGLTPSTSFRSVARAMSMLFASDGPRRVLFHRGETFTAPGTVSTRNRTGPFAIGAYGSGANPVIAFKHADDGIGLDPTVRDVRIVDVDLSASNPATSGYGFLMGRESLLLRSTVSGFATGVGGNHSGAIDNTVSDCALIDNLTYGMYYAAVYHPTVPQDAPVHLAIMGTRFDNTKNSLLRTYVSRSLWQFNLFQRSQTSPTRLLGSHEPKKSEFVIISGNQFESSSAWILEIGPENSQNDNGVPQVVENVVVEGNRFSLPAPANVYRFIMIWGSHVTVRNNVFDHTRATWGAVISVARRGIGPVPVGVRIDNNTAYRGTASSEPWWLVDADSGDPTLVRNNIVYSPAAPAAVAKGTVLEQNNLALDPLFQDAAHGDFHLRAGSPAIDKGLPLNHRTDVDGVGRTLRSGYDIGAFERP